MFSIEQALKNACMQFNPVVESPRLEAELLLSHILKSSRTQLRTWPEKQLTELQIRQFDTLVANRLTGEPIAYLIGNQGFWTLDLIVTPDTLIPRPETELLVERALEKIPLRERWQIADLGTGCGTVVLALAKERPQCQFIATDTSAAALEIARQNARLNNIENVSFIQSHWFKEIGLNSKFEMIVSNPPYIPSTDPHLQRGDVRYEPVSALAAGRNGLDDLQIITQTAGEYLSQNGWLVLEHGFDQQSSVIQLMQQAQFHSVEDFCDLNQQPRVVIGQKL